MTEKSACVNDHHKTHTAHISNNLLSQYTTEYDNNNITT